MKKIYFSIAFGVTAILSASCSNTEEIKGAEPQISNAPIIYATQETSTKSSITVDGEGVGTIYWSPADDISIFYGASTPVLYTSTNIAPETTAAFTTSAIIGSTELASTNIWGLYPHDPSAICDGSSITTTLPSTQYGVAGTFDDDLYLTVAHSDNTNLHFFNVCGGIKFSLSRDDITSISFSGNNNEDIAGDISISFVEGLPKVDVVSGVKTITITPKGGGTFAADTDYYIIVLPQSLTSGFTMTLESTDGSTGTINYTDKAVNLKRSVFGKKADIDTYAFFRIPIPDNQIWYTSKTGSTITTNTSRESGGGIVYNIIISNAFGDANIISNVYSDGKGIITFDSPVTIIDKEAFKCCSNLTSLVLPNCVETIGRDAFFSCSLESIYIPNSVTTIEMGAFYRCSSMTSIYIPDSVSSLGSNAFIDCTNLSTIRLPRGLTTISGGLFYNCSSLTEIPLPDGITTILSQAFVRCTSLASFTIPEAVTVIDSNVFSDCSSLSSVTLHDGITLIDAFAFRNCISLSSIDIPSSVTEIGWRAFTGCTGFTTLSIPSGVVSVGKEAFIGCTGLSSIVFNSVTPPAGGTDMFEDTNNCPIYVPAESVDDYKAAENWSAYSERIFALP